MKRALFYVTVALLMGFATDQNLYAALEGSSPTVSPNLVFRKQETPWQSRGIRPAFPLERANWLIVERFILKVAKEGGGSRIPSL